ncbi:MAG: hypothetical protein ACRDQ5_08425 [Sciscionella sp.]
MSAQPERETSGAAECWCCGDRFAGDELVHLGGHPEVALCLRCARWVHRRAVERDDARHRTTGTPLRAAIRAARAQVIARGWHERAILGALLRRIDRHLP